MDNFFSPLIRKQESRVGPLKDGFGRLTYAPGSIQSGEISLRTLAEVAADGVGALAHAAQTWHVGTLVQVCAEERTNEGTPQKVLRGYSGPLEGPNCEFK